MSRPHLSIAHWHSASNTLQTCLDRFLLHQEAGHHTAKTPTHYRYTLGNCLRYLAGQGMEAPEDVGAQHVRAFLAHLQRQGYKDTTLHAHARGIKTFLGFLVSDEVLTTSPMRKVTMPKLERAVRAPGAQGRPDPHSRKRG